MGKLIEFEKWFLSRMYGEDSMTNKVYDEISKKIDELKCVSVSKEVIEKC